MQQVSPSRGLVNTALLVVVIWGLATARPFLVPLSIAALLAFMMAPLVHSLRRLRVPEWVAITVSAVVLLLPLLGLIYATIRQGQGLIADFPKIRVSLEGELDRLTHSALWRRMHLPTELGLSGLADRLASRAGQGLAIAIAGLGAILNAGSQLALVLLYTVLMLASRAKLRGSIERILARNKEIAAASMIDDVSSLIQRFLIARMIIGLIIAVADLGILMGFKIQYAFLMAVFLGVMTAVPAIGFVIGLIPPVVVSLASGQSILSTALMSGALGVMSLVEGNILTPKLVGGKLNINALATFIGLFAGGLLWGIWGMLLSVPILGIMRIAFSASPELQPWGELLADKERAHGTSARQLKRETDNKKRVA